jgi:uncharacterized protein YaiI (UPF0178 family)
MPPWLFLGQLDHADATHGRARHPYLRRRRRLSGQTGNLSGAERYGLKVLVVANSFVAVPRSELIERVIVSEGPDVADGWIVERVSPRDIVITADIPLAGRCVRKGATVIGPTGKPFTEDSIGMALATRDLLTDLRSAGAVTRGPPPLSRQDISRFLSALDLAVTRLQRKFNPSS